MYERCMQMVEHEINRIVASHTQANMPEDWDLDGLVKQFDAWGIPIPDDVFPEYINKLRRDTLSNNLVQAAEEAYARKEQELARSAEELELPESGESIMRRFERQIVLQVVDSLWQDHIDHLDVLRVGIQLRGIAQRDPLVEFKSEAYNAFEQLKEDIEHHVTDMLFRAQIQLQVPAPAPAPALPSNLKTNVEAIAQASGQSKGVGSSAAQPKTDPSATARQPGQSPARQNRGGKGMSGSRHNGSHDRPATRPNQAQPRPPSPKAGPPQRAAALAGASTTGATAKPGRNDPCYCGSGRKYKLCHGR
jgi:preprotein translocase subunit SecA